MARGGRRRHSGRKRGVPNKASALRERRVARSGAVPLDVMLHVMRFHYARAQKAEEGKTPAQRRKVQAEMTLALNAARVAAPYVHPTYASVKHSGHLSFDPSKLSDRELDTVESILAKSASTERAGPDSDREGSTRH